MPKKRLRKCGNSGGDLCDGQAGGVGGEERVRRKMRQDAREQRRLDFEIFGDSFDDPVALRELGQIVVEVAGSDEPDERRLKECCRLGFCESVEGSLRERTPGASRLWRKVEQERGDSSVGQMRGDAGAHGSRAEHSGAANEQRLRIKWWSGSCGRGGGAHASSPWGLKLAIYIRRKRWSAYARQPRRVKDGTYQRIRRQVRSVFDLVG